MGDCPYEERVATSNGVFSSEFKHYIYDNIPLLYMYTLFVSHDLLASAGADMPSGSEHSSEAGILSRRVAQPMPLPLPTKRRRSVGGYEIHDFCDAMREYATKPVELKQSEDLRRLRHFSAERMKVAVMRERVELSSAVQAELCGVCAPKHPDVCRFRLGGADLPFYEAATFGEASRRHGTRNMLTASAT